MLSLILVIASIAIAFLAGLWMGMAISLPTKKPKQPRKITKGEKLKILEVLRQQRKIYALKLYRKWTGATLKQASEAINRFKKEIF
ncbi:conserved hypothetical protein [Gloeothece citriformis PCC 7424]|uniref:50S ribosomal protein L7/L12 n=1 Tax=Gloeothece citriformis (strain PCC 7424) TaxID=65393 RepID=B7KL03_GLOC7|nr:hypothetical protein [Gloeothece citriformis]ACK72375.1 conserved hypothetical protein [Gloeothece citriformis PCC 7424]